jgi:hypothetical protein
MKKFRGVRILVLLAILAFVAIDQFGTTWNITNWDNTVWVGVYPVNADGSPKAAAHIARLQETDFAPLADWFSAEAGRHGITLHEPLRIRLGNTLQEMPPLPSPEHNLLDRILWQFSLRSWAGDNDRLPDGLSPDIRLFLLYYDPESSPALPHSLGLQKGLVGIVHVFADRRLRGSNQVVIAHELLHTLGASDKYDPATNLPAWPDGYAEPQREPLHPQTLAEIMGGRIPLSDHKAEIPRSLEQARINDTTGTEIGWK